MLVLTRKEDDQVILSIPREEIAQLAATQSDVEIVLTVYKITDKRARLGFDAPGSVRINRGEVAARDYANAAAKRTAPHTRPLAPATKQ